MISVQHVSLCEFNPLKFSLICCMLHFVACFFIFIIDNFHDIIHSQALSGFYTKYVEQGAPNSWPVKLWAALSQNTILKEKLIEFFDSQTDFSKRLTSWKANSKVIASTTYFPILPSLPFLHLLTATPLLASLYSSRVISKKICSQLTANALYIVTLLPTINCSRNWP